MLPLQLTLFPPLFSVCFFLCLSLSPSVSRTPSNAPASGVRGGVRGGRQRTSQGCADLWSICYEADLGVRVPQGQKGPAQGQAASVASEPRTAGARSPLAPSPPGSGIVPAVRPGGPGPDVRRGQRSLVLHKHVAGQGSGGGDDSGPEAAGREAESFEPLTSAAAQEGGSGKAAWLTARPRARGVEGTGTQVSPASPRPWSRSTRPRRTALRRHRIHPAASLHFNYRRINIHEPGLEGDRGLSSPRPPAHPRAPLPR